MKADKLACGTIVIGVPVGLYQLAGTKQVTDESVFTFNGERIVFSTNDAGTIGYSPAKYIYELTPLPPTIYKY